MAPGGQLPQFVGKEGERLTFLERLVLNVHMSHLNPVESSNAADLTEVVIYDCDDFTQQHYLHLCGYNQRRSRTSFFDGDLFDVISDMSRPKAIGPKVLECAGVTG